MKIFLQLTLGAILLMPSSAWGQAKMYWVDLGRAEINRANLNGSNPQTILQGKVATFLALDTTNQKMYWTGGGKIWRADIDGTNDEVLLDTNIVDPQGIALDVAAGKMYWTDSRTDKIQRANLDGSEVEDLVTQGLSNPEGIALDVAAGKMYWTDFGTDKIQRANLDGSGIEDLITSRILRPTGIVICKNIAQIQIEASQTSICAGEVLTVSTSQMQNQGERPSFQWQINGQNVGNNRDFYSTNSLRNGARIRCILQSSLPCSAPVISNEIIVQVLGTPSVEIVPNVQGDICADTKVTFTADTQDLGINVNYQWLINGELKASTNTSTFTTDDFILNLENSVQVILSGDIPCVASNQPITASPLRFKVLPQVTPSVSLSIENINTRICENELATFNAVPNGGGVEPRYQWYINDIPQGGFSENSSFSTNDLEDQDRIRVAMISRLSCAVEDTVFSNPIFMEVIPVVAPTIEIESNVGGIACVGEHLIFRARESNAGINPRYRWRVNGINQTNLSPDNEIFVLPNASSDFTISVEMQADIQDTCLSNSAVFSDNLEVNVFSELVPTVNISLNQPNPICPGSEVIFTASPNLVDTSAAFRWFINNQPVGKDSLIFAPEEIQEDDEIRVEYTTSFSCATSQMVSSPTIIITVQALESPSDLIADAISEHQINLTWNDVSDREDRFIIERSENDDSNFIFHDFTFAGQTTYEDAVRVNPRTTYFYRVKAVNTDINCESAYSNVSGAATPGDTITSLSGEIAFSGLSVHPNPSTDGSFQLSLENNFTGKYQILISNALQQIVHQEVFRKRDALLEKTLDVSNLPSGLYYLHLLAEQGQSIIKILK